MFACEYRMYIGWAVKPCNVYLIIIWFETGNLE